MRVAQSWFCRKTSMTAQRPFKKSCLYQELKLIDEYGPWNKCEVWRVKLSLAEIHKAARELLTLDEKDPRRLFESSALLRHFAGRGLDYILGLKTEGFLERHLWTQVFKLVLAKSNHHALVQIGQHYIRVCKQVVNILSFLVCLDYQKHIADFSLRSPYEVSGSPGCVKRKNAKKGHCGAGAATTRRKIKATIT